ncbi:MAG TPA: hypothetical protein VJS40_02855 [Aestuariivirgaceae bacterium]|nr:hypothetical protein [Aestuariivirgaceae bacterium]
MRGRHVKTVALKKRGTLSERAIHSPVASRALARSVRDRLARIQARYMANASDLSEQARKLRRELLRDATPKARAILN